MLPLVMVLITKKEYEEKVMFHGAEYLDVVDINIRYLYFIDPNCDVLPIYIAGSRRVLATAVDDWSGKPYCVSS
jgi:hypothetical protein